MRRRHACLPAEQTNSKALYRRGVARSNLGLLDEAKEDLLEALKTEPNSKDIRREIATVKEKIAATKKAEKKAFGGFLNKVRTGWRGGEGRWVVVVMLTEGGVLCGVS